MAMNSGELVTGAARAVPEVLVGIDILAAEVPQRDPDFFALGAADTAEVDARSVRKRDVNNILNKFPVRSVDRRRQKE